LATHPDKQIFFDQMEKFLPMLSGIQLRDRKFIATICHQNFKQQGKHMTQALTSCFDCGRFSGKYRIIR